MANSAVDTSRVFSFPIYDDAPLREWVSSWQWVRRRGRKVLRLTETCVSGVTLARSHTRSHTDRTVNRADGLLMVLFLGREEQEEERREDDTA